MRKLEEELGVSLFERLPGAVVVTPLGQRVVEQAQQVLEAAAVIPQLAVQGQDELAGVLRLGVIYTIGPYLLPYLIPLLRDRAPRMPLQIEENYTAALSERLKQSELDVLILALPFEEPGIRTRALYEEPFVVVLPKGHRLEREAVITAHELAQEDLLLLGPGHCFRDQVLQACPECHQTRISADNMQKTLEGGSLETIRLMVATGMGVTVLPQTSVNNYPYPSQLLSSRPFADPAPQRVVALAWRKGFPRPKVIEVLAQAVLDCPLGEGVRLLGEASP